MAENKTKMTDDSAEEFLDRIENDRKRIDGIALVDLMLHHAGCGKIRAAALGPG
jgi:hypothetical protein